jgi:DNA-binding transcriptional ArsR family regulator
MTDPELYESISNNAEIVAEHLESAGKAVARIADLYQMLARNIRGAEAVVDELAEELRAETATPPDFTGDADWTCEDNAHDTDRPPPPQDGTQQSIAYAFGALGKPATFGEIAKQLKVETDKDKAELRKALARFVEIGILTRDGERRGTRYSLAERSAE